MSHLLYLMFRCDFDVMKSLESLREVNTALVILIGRKGRFAPWTACVFPFQVVSLCLTQGLPYSAPLISWLAGRFNWIIIQHSVCSIGTWIQCELTAETCCLVQLVMHFYKIWALCSKKASALLLDGTWSLWLWTDNCLKCEALDRSPLACDLVVVGAGHGDLSPAVNVVPLSHSRYPHTLKHWNVPGAE